MIAAEAAPTKRRSAKKAPMAKNHRRFFVSFKTNF
jgi:hypothetical protein